MKLEFTNSLEDIKDVLLTVNKLSPIVEKERNYYKLGFTIPALILYIILIFYYNSRIFLFSRKNIHLFLILSFTFLVGILLWNKYLVYKLFEFSAKVDAVKCAKTMPRLLATQTLTIDKNELTLQMDGEKYVCPLKTIYKVLENKGNIYIFKNLYAIIAIIPNTAFKDSEEKETFLKALNID